MLEACNQLGPLEALLHVERERRRENRERNEEKETRERVGSSILSNWDVATVTTKTTIFLTFLPVYEHAKEESCG